MNTDQKIILTKQQAIALIGKRKLIHTFRSGTNVLMGADHTRKSLLEDIKNSDLIEIGGAACKKMGHGLVIWTGDDPLFVEVDKIELENLEKELTK
jgi:hypothetical protein